MDIQLLDAFSRQFADRLFATHPEWLEFAQAKEAKEGHHYLYVEVPAPAGSDLSTGLCIWTDAGEVSVGFDEYHAHFAWPASDQDITLNPMTFIEAVLADQVGAASASYGGESTVAWLFIPGQEEDVDLDDLSEIQVRVRSWNGELNRDFTIPPEDLRSTVLATRNDPA